VVATRKKSWRLDGHKADRQRDWLGVSGGHSISSSANAPRTSFRRVARSGGGEASRAAVIFRQPASERSPPRLRARGADTRAITNDAAAGNSGLAVMRRAGHSDFQVTQQYLDLAGVDFAEEAERAAARAFAHVPRAKVRAKVEAG
jgi:integrase